MMPVRMVIVMTLNSVFLPNVIGLLVGFIGVSIAIYLQLIQQNPCPPKYVLGFFVFGVLMIFINGRAVITDMTIAIILQTIGYILLAIMEIYTAYIIRKRIMNNPYNENSVDHLILD